MSCWRVLQLSEDSTGETVPQLLIKPAFAPEGYTVFLTDLSNIWREELDLGGVLKRSSEQDSPIEVTSHDTTQLTILLDHIKQSLMSSSGSAETTREVTQGDGDGIVLHTSCKLPGPLGTLKWKFDLQKRTSAVLKNELILPLLVSSHIQHERINDLLSALHEKDRVIARFLDQFESSHLDLALAFPSLAALKAGRRMVKREQAVRQVLGLQPFHEEEWKRHTSQLQDGHLSTLSLFQEALSECNPQVPAEMKSDDTGTAWWLSVHKPLVKTKATVSQKPKKASTPPESSTDDDDDGTETEDEFETHENYKLREAQKQKSGNRPSKSRTAASRVEVHRPVSQDDTETEDDNLDAPPQNRNKSHSRARNPRQDVAPSRTTSINVSAPPRSSSPEAALPRPKKRAGFKIGGPRGSNTVTRDEESPGGAASTNSEVALDVNLPKPKKTFKIGGKNKASSETRDETPAPSLSPKAERKLSGTKNEDQGYSKGEAIDAEKVSPSATTPEENHEETPEEKAERRRQELKRRNEELARKQVHKKKRRF